jgi:hypothetical protein
MSIASLPSGPDATIGPMFQVELICSDPRCEAELTCWVDELAEVEALACDCGHGLVTVRIEGFEPLFAVV